MILIDKHQKRSKDEVQQQPIRRRDDFQIEMNMRLSFNVCVGPER